MKSSIKFSFLVLICLLATACGDKKETTGIPTPPPETDPNSGQNDLPIPDIGQDDRIPDLSTSFAFTTTQEAGLSALFGGVFLPLVGEPRLKFDLTRVRGGSDYATGNYITGKIFISMEDQEGFVSAELPSFGYTGRTNTDGSVVNVVFQDRDIMILLAGSIASDKINGTLYYRTDRSNVALTGYFSGTVPVCTKVTFNCPHANTTVEPYRSQYLACMDSAKNNKINLDNKCLLHMQTGQELGTFEGTYSDMF